MNAPNFYPPPLGPFSRGHGVAHQQRLTAPTAIVEELANTFHRDPVGSPSSVNPALTPHGRVAAHPASRPTRRRNVVENDDYARFTRRVITAYGRRIAGGDIEGLAPLADLGQQLDAVLEQAIVGLRASGFSWADIGARLGITRQATQQRWGGEPPQTAGQHRPAP